MKNIILGILIIFAAESQAQIAFNLKSREKYQKEHSTDPRMQRKLKKRDFFIRHGHKKEDETSSGIYEKTLKRERRHNAKLAARYVKHPDRLDVRIKEKNKVGI